MWWRFCIPVVKIKNIKGDTTVDMADADCVPETLLTSKLQKFVLKDRDVLVAMTGATAGKVGRVRTQRPILLNQRVAKIEPVAADRDFIWSIVSSEEYQKTFFYLADGAAQPNMSGGQIEGVEIPLPPVRVQRRIASILAAYDELMENCQRRIRILEEMARALYREWFVNFRFPSHEKGTRVDSSIGPIPRGWAVTTVGESFEITGGGTPSREVPDYWTDGDIQWYSPRDLTAASTMFIEDSTDHINTLGLQKSSARLFPSFSVMMSSRATIGAIAINTHEACTNQGFITCMPNERVPLYFLHQWLTENVPMFERLASGATFKEISRGVFKTIDLLRPEPSLVRRFESFVEPAAKQLLTLQRKIANLRRTRDLLLPRLLSGQVSLDVSAVEDAAEPTATAPTLSQTDFASEEPALRAAEEAPPYRVEPAGNILRPAAKPADEATPVPIDQIDRTEVLQVIRQLFSEGPPRERDAAIRDVARALGYRRTGARIQEILRTDLMTAVRRCILENQNGALRLCARSITDYDRDFLKQQFLAAIGRAWIDRETAIRDFCRWLGFARTGPIIEDTARSLINGLLREGRLEGNGVDLIRRS